MALPPEEQVQCLLDLGLRVDHPTEEEVALYVDAELDASAIAELAVIGVIVQPGFFVPPVPGRHARGFHLAMVGHPSLEAALADPRVTRMASLEARGEATNDTSTEFVGINAIRAGECVFPRTGAGVKLAIIDSGYDDTLSDLPVPYEAFDISDGMALSDWGTDLNGPLAGHGTHVAGVAVGDGTLSSDVYTGGAPDVDLMVYKTWNDVDGNNYEADLIRALEQAVAAGAQIVNMSVGVNTTFLDGSSPLCQTVDYATSEGVLVVVAAGNEAISLGHATVTLAPGETSEIFTYDVVNFLGEPYSQLQRLQVIWRDGALGDGNIRLICPEPATEPCPVEQYYESSDRGTEAKGYTFQSTVDTAAVQSFALQLVNDATEGDPVTVHVFRYLGLGRFSNADPTNTVQAPGVADTSLAVGAWVSRSEYTDSEGNVKPIAQGEFDQIASFSSRGPRIDGLAKPDISAPGTAIISLRASQAVVATTALVDDDGIIGEGGVNHMVRTGTSFASPMVCAGAAILMEAAPYLTAAEIRDVLQRNSSRGDDPDNAEGHGLMDVHAALIEVTNSNCSLMIPSTGAVVYADGGEVELKIDGTPEYAFDAYIVLGSLSGTEPGLMIDAVTTLPLNFDAYLSYGYLHPNQPPLLNGFGMLDEDGRANATFTVGPDVLWLFPGMEIHHAVMVLRMVPMASWVQLSDPAVRTEVR